MYNETEKMIDCQYAAQCGACDYVNIAYSKELADKEKQVRKLFKGICETEKINGMFRPAYYRNKVHRNCGIDADKKLILGNYEKGTHDLVISPNCGIEDKKSGILMEDIGKLLFAFKYEPYDEDSKRGLIRHILIRRGISTGQVMVVLVTGDIMFPSKNNFMKELLKIHPEITTIVQNINNASTSMVLGKRNKTIYGNGYIEDVLCGNRFRISPSSFYQINVEQTEKLYKNAIKMADISKNDTVIDAYCGIGTIGITVAKHAKNVIGVELNADAVDDAKINASINNIKNITFECGDAGEFLKEYAVNNKCDIVIMDPPRSGSSEDFINALLKIKPQKIVYISCNPETQVRDVNMLSKAYKVEMCKPFDLFPHTSHIENIVLMSKQMI